jgi:hypothetical protein
MAQLNVITSDGSEQPSTATSVVDLQQTAPSNISAPSSQAGTTDSTKVMNIINAEASGSEQVQISTGNTTRSKILIGGVALAIAIFCIALLLHYKQLFHRKLNKPKT